MFTTPRQVLAALAMAMIVIGIQTFRYPPEYLTVAWLWSALAIVCGLLCLLAALTPRRFYVASSGATLVTASAARGIALLIEWLSAETDREAGFIVGAMTWWLVAFLGYIVWREYVLPWSLGRRRRWS